MLIAVTPSLKDVNPAVIFGSTLEIDKCVGWKGKKSP